MINDKFGCELDGADGFCHPDFPETDPDCILILNENQTVAAFDAVGGDQFGLSVSISGDVAIIGAPFDQDAGANTGSAYIFRLDALGNCKPSPCPHRAVKSILSDSERHR